MNSTCRSGETELTGVTGFFQGCDEDGDGALEWKEVKKCEVNKRHFLKNSQMPGFARVLAIAVSNSQKNLLCIVGTHTTFTI